MKHLKLTFGDIMQSNILYYDEKEIEACLQICDRLKINNLPSVDGKSVFILDNGQFIEQVITEENKFFVNERIFFDERDQKERQICEDYEKSKENENSLKVLSKFKENKHNVVFVFEGDALQGVVHFCDYNQNAVLQSIQSDILRFERNLREYLQFCGFNNQSILDYFTEKSKKETNKQKEKQHYTKKLIDIEKKKDKMQELGEFQLFDFSDLMGFCNSSSSGKIFTIGKSDSIRELRNMAMHGKNPVSIDHESVIYSIDSLAKFFADLKEFRSLSNMLISAIHSHKDYIDSISLANRKKLEIIHQHRPKALEFFINHKY
jgi:hypothetical protein